MKFYPLLTEPDFGFFRLRGVGIGNLLFPYFRAYVYTKKYGGSIIEPPWLQVKLNQLRYLGTKKSRLYWALFNREQSGITSLSARIPYSGKRIVREREWISQGCPSLGEKDIVIVKGMDPYFNILEDFRNEIKKEYRNMLAINDARSLIAKEANPYIAMHMRLGDFFRNGDSEGRNVALPLNFAISAIELVQRELRLPVYLITDAEGDELGRLISTGACVPQTKSVLEDFHWLMGAKILIASASTFSMWSAFLGSSKVVYNKEMCWFIDSEDCIGYSDISEFSAVMRKLICNNEF